MNSDGGQAHLLLRADPDFHLYNPTWIADGKRIAYLKRRNENGKTLNILESRNLKSEDPVTLIENPDMLDATLGQPGRFIYSVREPAPREREANLWELKYDNETGRPKGAPQRLTDWSGFLFLNPGVSVDGKHFVFLNEKDQAAVYVGELAASGDELKNPRRLTLNENFNWPAGWSQDSSNVLFYSNREGNFGIYRQPAAEKNAETISSGSEQKWAPAVSPDGKWILYMQWEKNTSEAAPNTGKLMRIPTTGGTPESVMEINGRRGGSQYVPLATVGGYPSFRCGRQVQAGCVLAERHENDIVFTSFDPMQGRKSEIARIPREGRGSSWDLSPDGSRIAFSVFSYTEGNISIIPTDGKPRLKIAVAPWTELDATAWSADGMSLYFGSYSSRGTAIVHTDLAGHSKMLYKPSWDIFALSPSPDGKYLAFGPVITDANAWAFGSFPEK